jgi:hypothetical protein
MKTKVLAALLLLTFGMNVSAQQNSKLTISQTKLLKQAQKEAAIINELLATSADVSPFYSPEEVKEFIVDYEKFSPEGEAWEIIDSCNNGAAQLIKEFVENEKYAALKVDTMLHTNKISSPDESIIIHNWYTNNGGTFMMFKNLAEVKLPNGKRQLIELDYAGTVYEIGMIPGEQHPSYYFIGSTKGCSSCFDYSVMMYSLAENGLEPMEILESVNAERDYTFAIFFRDWDFDNNYISYNEIDHAFEYGHKNDDAEGEDVFYEEGRWTFDGNLFRQEVTMQIDREEFGNLFGESDNN